MKTKTVEVSWKDAPVNVILKELTFGEKNELLEQSTEVTGKGGELNTTINVRKLKEFALLKGIKEAAFDITISNIRNLTASDGENLYTELDKLNNPDPKD
tara:strand:- start:5714 stop:6013 length:300 start_codon:yes stop_codon:yes gene_type:complete